MFHQPHCGNLWKFGHITMSQCWQCGHTQVFAHPQYISMGFSSQWNFGRNQHLCPAASMISCMYGFSALKSCWFASIFRMQQLTPRDSCTNCACNLSGLSPPCAAASALQWSVSCASYDILHVWHSPIAFPLFAAFRIKISPRSSRTRCIPFGCPQNL